MQDYFMQGVVECYVDSQSTGHVVLNRPEKHNAFDDDMIGKLRECFDYLSSSAAARVVILRAEGKSFSAGADLSWMQRMANYDYAANLKDAQALAGMLKALRQMPQPTIAQVQGSAFGGAVGLIACCDIAIAATQCRFGLTEVRIGLIPATIAPHVIDAIGPRWSRRLFQTGELVNADRAESIGLVHEVCNAAELFDCVAAVRDQLLGNSPRAMREAKVLVADVAGRALTDELLADTSERIASIRVSTEGQEGLLAFLEKRPASWLTGEK